MNMTIREFNFETIDNARDFYALFFYTDHERKFAIESYLADMDIIDIFDMSDETREIVEAQAFEQRFMEWIRYTENIHIMEW